MNTKCPKCGYSAKDKDDPLMKGECPSCGVIVGKYIESRKRQRAGNIPRPLAKELVSGDSEKKFTKIGIILIVFAAINFLTAIVFNGSSSIVINENLPSTGGIVGPIAVPEDKTVYQINVHQSVNRDNLWSFVSGEVLDINKNYLFGFGDEFWQESGYDSDGHWREWKNKYDLKVTLEKGSYFLNFSTEKSRGVNRKINVKVRQMKGSSLPFWITGIAGIVLGLFFVFLDNRKS